MRAIAQAAMRETIPDVDEHSFFPPPPPPESWVGENGHQESLSMAINWAFGEKLSPIKAVKDDKAAADLIEKDLAKLRAKLPTEAAAAVVEDSPAEEGSLESAFQGALDAGSFDLRGRLGQLWAKEKKNNDALQQEYGKMKGYAVQRNFRMKWASDEGCAKKQLAQVADSEFEGDIDKAFAFMKTLAEELCAGDFEEGCLKDRRDEKLGRARHSGRSLQRPVAATGHSSGSQLKRPAVHELQATAPLKRLAADEVAPAPRATAEAAGEESSDGEVSSDLNDDPPPPLF